MRDLTDLEKIEVAGYVIEVLDQTKHHTQNGEPASWMARARALLEERTLKYLKNQRDTGSHL